jgi:hypothetical protein
MSDAGYASDIFLIAIASYADDAIEQNCKRLLRFGRGME